MKQSNDILEQVVSYSLVAIGSAHTHTPDSSRKVVQSDKPPGVHIVIQSPQFSSKN